MIAAGDTFRAAAIDQLQIWGDRLNIPVIAGKEGGDSAAVAFDAVQAAIARGMDILIIDTAGRLQSRFNLMEELKKVHRVIGKALEGAPHATWIVLDATTGQNALSQAKAFKESVKVNGVILAKLDTSAKGGMAFAIAKELDLPIIYAGLGEKPEDLERFNRNSFVEGIIGDSRKLLMQDLVEQILLNKQKVDELIRNINLDKVKDSLISAQRESQNPDLWEDREHAQKVLKQVNDLQDEISEWEHLSARVNDALELSKLNDESLRTELEKEIGDLDKEIERKGLSALLSGKHDIGNAILAIHAGAGGTEAHDWASMLQRMFLRWAEDHKYTCDIVDFTPGEEAGTKSITITVTGKYAFGYLKSEKGTHRLVRLSPFDAAHRRHTSFAMVEVLPEAIDDDSIEIPQEDIRIDVYKSSGAGGQNVQKNSTAVPAPAYSHRNYCDLSK